MMSHKFKVKVQPGDEMHFPGICVHCAQPAGKSMTLRVKREDKVREIDVPLCDDCAAILRRNSGEEERMIKLGRLLLIVASLAGVILMLLLVPSSFSIWLRLGLSLMVGLVVAAIVRRLWRRVIFRAAAEQKREIRESATLETFSWRSATFEFANEAFAERFQELNEASLIGDEVGG